MVSNFFSAASIGLAEPGLYHLTAVIDGVIYDTHNCSRGGTRCVYGYFSLSEQPARANALWQRAAA